MTDRATWPGPHELSEALAKAQIAREARELGERLRAGKPASFTLAVGIGAREQHRTEGGKYTLRLGSNVFISDARGGGHELVIDGHVVAPICGETQKQQLCTWLREGPTATAHVGNLGVTVRETGEVTLFARLDAVAKAKLYRYLNNDRTS